MKKILMVFLNICFGLITISFFRSPVLAEDVNISTSPASCAMGTMGSNPTDNYFININSDSSSYVNETGPAQSCFTISGSNVYLTDGTGSWLNNCSISLSEGDIIKCEYDGTNIVFSINSTPVCSVASNNNNSGTNLHYNSASGVLSNFESCASTPTPTTEPTPTATPTTEPTPTPTPDSNITPTPTPEYSIDDNQSQIIPQSFTAEWLSQDEFSKWYSQRISNYNGGNDDWKFNGYGLSCDVSSYCYDNAFWNYTGEYAKTYRDFRFYSDVTFKMLARVDRISNNLIGLSLVDSGSSIPDDFLYPSIPVGSDYNLFIVNSDYNLSIRTRSGTVDTKIPFGGKENEFIITYSYLSSENNLDYYNKYIYVNSILVAKEENITFNDNSFFENGNFYGYPAITIKDSNSDSESYIKAVNIKLDYLYTPAEENIFLCVRPANFTMLNPNIHKWLDYYWCIFKNWITQLYEAIAKAVKKGFLETFVPTYDSTFLGDFAEEYTDYISSKAPFAYIMPIVNGEQDFTTIFDSSGQSVLADVEINLADQDITIIDQSGWTKILSPIVKLRPVFSVALFLCWILYGFSILRRITEL